MDAPNPRRRDDLNPTPIELERRLAGWAPAPAPAGRDRLLYEAGRASARGGWRGAGGLAGLAALALGLGVWGAREHGRRLALEGILVARTRSLDAALARLETTAGPSGPAAQRAEDWGSAAAPGSYLALRRRLAGLSGDAAAALDLGPDRASTPPAGVGPAPAARAGGFTPLSAWRDGGLTDF